MIRVRRMRSANPLLRKYELQFSSSTEGSVSEHLVLRRGSAVRRLERDVGVGDAWSFIDEADRKWSEGSSGWAVEYEERGLH